MGEGKHRLLGRLRTAALGQRRFEPSRALTHFKATVYTWTDDGDRLSWGPNGAKLLGHMGASLPSTGKAFSAMVEPGMGFGRTDAIAADAVVSHPRGMPYQLQYGLRLDDGTIVTAEDRGRWFADRSGRPAMAHGTLTILGKVETHLLSAQTRARSDFLAAITHHAGNRGALRAVSLIALAITFPDLGTGSTELLGGVHDHPHGQEIIDEIIARTRGVMRHNDRMLVNSDGSIAVALLGCTANELVSAALRLQTRLTGSPVVTSGGDVAVCVRLGAASAPDHAATALTLLCHAEEALRTSLPGMPVTVYNGLEQTSMALEKSLKTFLDDADALSETALDANLVLARRPLLDAGSRLATLHLAGPGRRNPDCQVVSAEYLRLAATPTPEFALRLDRHLLTLTCEELSSNQNSFSLLPISDATLACNEWPIILAAALGTHSEVASRLIIGISESAIAANPALAERRMVSMKALGIGVAVVDFGGGFLPCSHLDNLPVDLVAIDGALVQNVTASTDNRFYLRGLIDTVQSRDIAVAALWVEDERTATLLGEWGVNYLEGRLKAAAPISQPARRRA